MASAVINETKISLKYPDKKSFSFSKLKPSIDDENLYEVAKILNAFQNSPIDKVVKVTTMAII